MTASTPLRMLIGSLIVALLTFIATALIPATAQADALIEAEPAAGETIGEEPEVVLLRFDRDLALERGVNQVSVFNAAGERVDDGHAEIAGYSPRTMVARLATPVEEGAVSVQYRVRFADSGETLEGAFDFAIEPGAVEDVPALVAATEARSEQSIVLWTVAIMLAIAVFALLLFYLRVATDNAKSSVEPPDDSHH